MCFCRLEHSFQSGGKCPLLPSSRETERGKKVKAIYMWHVHFDRFVIAYGAEPAAARKPHTRSPAHIIRTNDWMLEKYFCCVCVCIGGVFCLLAEVKLCILLFFYKESFTSIRFFNGVLRVFPSFPWCNKELMTTPSVRKVLAVPSWFFWHLQHLQTSFNVLKVWRGFSVCRF